MSYWTYPPMPPLGGEDEHVRDWDVSDEPAIGMLSYWAIEDPAGKRTVAGLTSDRVVPSGLPNHS